VSVFRGTSSFNDSFLDASKIYIRTESAWYILGRPSKLYRDDYTPFWTQVCILHLIIAKALQNPKSTYDEFINDFDDPQFKNKFIVSAKMILGRDLNRDDLEQDNIVRFLNVSCFIFYN